MDKPQALIIGINNFLGKAIFELIKGDCVITGVYNQNKENLPNNINLVQSDDISTLQHIAFKYIYLVSSYVPRGSTVSHDERLTEVNILLPKNICMLFPLSRVVFCSSVSVYENRNSSSTITVDEPLTPISRYALSKVWGEQIIKEHPSFAIIRISSMYGVGMNEDTFVPKIIRNALINKQINLLGDGERRQNYVHVEDVAKIAVGTALTHDNITMLAVDDQSYSNKEIAATILELTSGNLGFSGSDNSASFVYDNGFTHKSIGPVKFKNIKEGLNEVLEWIRKKY